MQPQSPVSVPPWDPPKEGSSNLPFYGEQSIAKWAPPLPGHALDAKEKQIIDTGQPTPYLWRVSIFGEGILLRIVYGSRATLARLDAVRTPFVGTFPGKVTIYARPLNPEVPAAVTATPTLTMASAGRSEMRALIDATGGAVAFHADAVRFIALQASTATIAGVAVAVAALATVPLVAGSTLLTGVGFQEFEP